MSTCRQARTLIVRTIDEETLSGEARAALRQHVAACAACREEYETQHEVRRLLALQIEDRLPPGFTERLNARLAQQEPGRLPSRLESSAGFESSPRVDSPAPFAASRARSRAQSLPLSAPVSSLGIASSVHQPWRRSARRRAWAIRLLPVAATVGLMVADARLRDRTPSPEASYGADADGTSVAITSPARARTGGRLRHRDPAHPSLEVGVQPPDAPHASHTQQTPHASGASGALGEFRAVGTPDALDTSAQAPASAADPRAADPRSAVIDARAVAGVAPTSHVAAPVAPARTGPIELTALSPALAPALADELKLSDAQRKRIAEIYDTRRHALREIIENTRKQVELERYQIDAAIERVLTPEQRKQYRQRLASQGSGILPAAPGTPNGTAPGGTAPTGTTPPGVVPPGALPLAQPVLPPRLPSSDLLVSPVPPVPPLL